MKVEVSNVRGSSFAVEFPDKCPVCSKDFAVTNRPFIYEVRDEKYIFSECPHCYGSILSVYNARTKRTIHTYPQNAFVKIQDEIKELSPNACRIFEQALKAGATGLSDLVGAGIRMSLEWLIWDYLIKIKHIPEDELKDKKLYKRLDYLKEDNYKLICANILRVFGNEEIHIFKDYNINAQDAINVLQALIDNIYAELIIMRVNSKLLKP